MTYFCGIDLGGRKSQICLIDNDDKVLCNISVASDYASVHAALKPYGSDVRIVAESTFNWDWLIDGLQADNYDVVLAHTLALSAISRAKVKTDKRDARTLAKLLKGSMIPEASICPIAFRGPRDILRKRWRLVAQRATEYRAIRFLLYRQGRWDHCLQEVKSLNIEDAPAVSDNLHLQLIAKHNLERIQLLGEQINELEKVLRVQTGNQHKEHFANLTSIPGIGFVLALTILLETGDITRFPDARKYSSYCRVVPGCANSSGVEKRGRNSKQGNRFLKWAFMHTAMQAVRHDPDFKALHTRHLKRHRGKCGKLIAYNTVAHRIAQAVFHILRDQQPLKKELLFHKLIAT